MITPTKISHLKNLQNLQEYLAQLKDTELGGTHDFSFTQLAIPKSSGTAISPKSLISEYYAHKYEDDDDSIYSYTTEYGIDMLQTPNWEDQLYQICQDMHIDSKYEDILDKLNEFIGTQVTSVWQISPKKADYQDDIVGFDSDESDTNELSTKWQDLLIYADKHFYLLHFGVLEQTRQDKP